MIDIKTETELKKKYEDFIKTEKGKKWIKKWKNNKPSDIAGDFAGDFGDFLYDFYPEMLQ